MDPAQAPARVTVVLLPILITVSKISSSQSKMPAVQYTTWLQRWMIGILMFQSMAMLVFVSVVTLRRRKAKLAERKLLHIEWLKHKESRCAVAAEAEMKPIVPTIAGTPLL